MFRRTSGGKVQGILSNWDSACNKDTEGVYNGDGMLVGTRPFMSKDLHVGRFLIYHERFDYESLLYSIYWICVFYSQGKSRPAREISEASKYWKKWNSHDDMDILHAKSSLISSGLDENYLSSFFSPLDKCWLDPVRELFHDGYGARTKYAKRKPNIGSLENRKEGEDPSFHLSQNGFNDETLGGHVTFEKIYDILCSIY